MSKMRGHGSQWFSNRIINWRPLQLKKKIFLYLPTWELFWSYRELPIWPTWPNFEVNGLDWQCCIAGSSKTAPRIFIFSIVLGAECLSYLKSIETHARAFSRLISDGISGVTRVSIVPGLFQFSSPGTFGLVKSRDFLVNFAIFYQIFFLFLGKP